MAIRDDTCPLQNLYPKWTLGRREFVWLYVYLQKGLNQRFSFSIDQNHAKDEITTIIKRYNLFDQIDKDRSKAFVSKSHIDWVSNNERQLKWLLKRFSDPLFFQFLGLVNQSDPSLDSFRHELTLAERFIAAIDSLPTDKYVKENILVNLKQGWLDKQLKERKYDWLCVKDEKLKCQIAWKWLIDNNTLQYGSLPAEFKKKNDVLTCFDDNNFSFEQGYYYLSEIKKKYKAEQTKANRIGRRQTNISISNSARKQLDELSSNYGLTKTELIERLICEEYQNNL